MTNGDMLEIGRSMLEIKESLDKAMDDARGAPLSTEALEGMSALYLLSLLAPNRIRFVYAPPKKGKQ